MTSEELDVAEMALASEINPSQTSTFVEIRTCINIDYHQAMYMKSKQRNILVTSDHFSTSADKLVSHLSGPGTSFMVLFAECRLDLLTIKQKSRVPNCNTIQKTKFEEELGDETETPEMFARTLEGTTTRDSLTHTVSSLILLRAVWTIDFARRKLDMFPKFWSMDDTEGTNIKERPLNNVCGKDGDTKVFCFFGHSCHPNHNGHTHLCVDVRGYYFPALLWREA